MKIAIIGTGISGLGAAWLLHHAHDITVYEPNNYSGGHSRTIDIRDGDATLPVDTGFIVFNYRNYPHLTGLFRHLDVPTIKSDMSFGASIADGWLEYGSKGMFAQKANLLRRDYWTMLADILRFNKTALERCGDRPDITLRALLDEMNMGAWFRRYYLLAMGAAIWSCPLDTILDFPASAFLRFFDNHGLLTVNDQPQWYTVKGGSREYVERLTKPFRSSVRLNCGARQVARANGAVTVEDTQGHKETYDHAILACHADQALAMLANPSPEERSILKAFTYQKNRVVVHGDVSFMPKRKACWSSWVYLSQGRDDSNPCVSLSYWMNQLQSFKSRTPVLITLNPGREPLPETVHDVHEFDHPMFTIDAIRAQERMEDIQGKANIWFCGAYQRYGFHEDGLMSAVAVARKLGAPIPWT